MSGRDAGHHHHRGGPIWQHPVWRPDGDRRCERGNPLRIRNFFAGRLRNRDRRLGIEFKISIPGRHPFRRTNAFIRTFARAGSHSGFSGCWKVAANQRGALPD